MNVNTDCRNGKDFSVITISVSDETNHGSIVSDLRTGNKQDVEENKSLHRDRDNGKNAIEFKINNSNYFRIIKHALRFTGKQQYKIDD